MKHKLIIGFIAKDKPGLVHALSEAVNRYQGNWLESKMSELGGRFSGMAIVEVSSEQLEALKTALQSLEGIASIVEEIDLVQELKNTRILGLNIVGPDRPGILHEVTLALEAHKVNVSDIETSVSAAPMSGELTFSADACIVVPYEMDWRVIAEQLDSIADQLGVDILLDEEPEQ